MKKKYSSFTMLTLALAALLGLSSLGSAQYLSQDIDGMTHMSWSPIVTANPLPAAGVKNVVPTTDGCFEATVQNETTGGNDYYSLDPSHLDVGWTKVDACSLDICTPLLSSSMPFAFGPNGFGVDAISLPDALRFNTEYSNNYPFYEVLVYGGNLIKYTAATSSVSAFYHIHTWPITDTIPGTPIDSSDARFPSFQSPSVFYAFLGDPSNPYEAGHCFYLASALEAKSNQYHSLVISYGLVQMTSTWSWSQMKYVPTYDFAVDVVADPIAPAGEVIVGIAASPQWHASRGYVAVADDGTSYFAQP